MFHCKARGHNRGSHIVRILLFFTAFTALCLAGCDMPLADKRDQLQALNAVANGAVFIDVRTPQEVAQGTFDNAMNIPHGDIVSGVEALALDKKTPIVVFCRSGNRSAKAKTALEEAGYNLVLNGGAYDDLQAVNVALEQQRAAHESVPVTND